MKSVYMLSNVWTNRLICLFLLVIDRSYWQVYEHPFCRSVMFVVNFYRNNHSYHCFCFFFFKLREHKKNDIRPVGYL